MLENEVGKTPEAGKKEAEDEQQSPTPPADKPPEANEANKAAASGETPEPPAASPTEGTLHLGSSSLPFLFFGVMGLLWLLPLFIRRRTR